MKRTGWMIYMLILCAWVFTSCGEDLETVGGTADKRAFTMQLNTRAGTTEPGEDALNENKINNVSVFFFADKEQPCTFMQRNISVDSDNRIKVTLGKEITDGNPYWIYVVANTVSKYTNAELKQKTLAQLRDMPVQSDLTQKDPIQPSFVMEGVSESAMTVTAGGTGGTVTLKRLAAKVILVPMVKDEIEVGGITYRADKTKMEVTLVNAATRATFSGNPLPAGTDQVFGNVIRTYSLADDGTTYAHIPCYSYPNKWTAPTQEEAKADEKETYMLFSIPWAYNQGGTQLSSTYYYRVPVSLTNSLESNNLYRISLNVEVLGSIDPSQTVDVKADYEISEWKSVEIPANLNRYAYLELETNYVEMNNESRADIGLTSSSEVTAKVVKVTYPDYSRKDIRESVMTEEDKPVEPNRNDYGGFWEPSLDQYYKDLEKYKEELAEWEAFFGENASTIVPYGQTLVFQHELPSTVYVPWTFTIEATNADGQKQELTITQYPPIYITGEYNSEGSSNRFVYGETTNETWVGEGWNGYYTVVDDNNKSLGGAHDPGNSGSSNNNKNQYTIHVTQLDADDEKKYIIGDPRDPTPTKLSSLTKYGTSSQKGLQSYLKTRGENWDEREYDRMIAPVFKIASSWGIVTTGSINYKQAQKRCASYQENGYPAGRWRIPTEGEIEFIVNLSNMGYIPKLFGGNYYASSQRYYIGGDAGTQGDFGGEAGYDKSNSSVRCIYDVWYWGDEKIDRPNTFTWGDTEPIRPNN